MTTKHIKAATMEMNTSLKRIYEDKKAQQENIKNLKGSYCYLNDYKTPIFVC